MKKSLSLFFAVSLAIFMGIYSGCATPAEEGISEEDAKKLMDNALAIWNEGNFDLIAETYFEDAYITTSSTPQPYMGHEGLTTWVNGTRQAFPDFRMTFDEIYVNGNVIAVKWTMKGTHTGPLIMPGGTLPATGKSVMVTGLAIDHIENGLIKKEEVYFNMLDMLLPLGFSLVPPMEETK